MLNKESAVVVTSLGTISLTAVLMAIIVSRRRRSQERRKLLTQSSESIRQVSRTARTEMATNNISASVSTDLTETFKGITVPVTLTVATPSAVKPSSSAGSSITASPFQTAKEQEASISDEARKAGESLKDLIISAIKDAKDSAKGTGKKLKEETVGIAATKDSKDIQSLGDNINSLVGLFEKMMVEIRKENYNEQIILLQSYKDLLRAQIKVASARGVMASRLKPGA